MLMKYATENNCEIDALKYLQQKTAKRWEKPKKYI